MDIKLTPETIQAINEDKGLRLKVQAAIKVTHNTVTKCLEDNDARLTQLNCLNVITEHLDKPLSEIINTKVSRLLCK